MGTLLAELPLPPGLGLAGVPSNFSLACDDLALDAVPNGAAALEDDGSLGLPPLAQGLSGTLLLKPSEELSAVLPSFSCDPSAAAASQLHVTTYTPGMAGPLLEQSRTIAPFDRHQQLAAFELNEVSKPVAGGCSAAALKPAGPATGKCNVRPTGVTVETGANNVGAIFGGKIKPRMPALQCTPADRMYCDTKPVKGDKQPLAMLNFGGIGEPVLAPELRAPDVLIPLPSAQVPVSPFAMCAGGHTGGDGDSGLAGDGWDVTGGDADHPVSLPALSRDGSSDVDVLGLCDAAGCDMADIADAMLADAAAALPGVCGGTRIDGGGVIDQHAAESPLTSSKTMAKGAARVPAHRPTTRRLAAQLQQGLAPTNLRAAAGADDCDSACETNSRRRRRPTPAHCGSNQKGNKRALHTGRLIVYHGDAESPNVTEEERRRIKRRKANRESAARVRLKRQQLVDDLEVQIQQLAEQNRRLTAHVEASDASAAEVAQQMAPLHRRWSAFVTDSFKLQGELAALRRATQAKQQVGDYMAGRTGWPTAGGSMAASCAVAPSSSYLAGMHHDLPTFITA